MKAVLYLQGSPTELLPLTCKAPACMIRLCGRALVEYNLERLAACGVRECTLVVKDGLEEIQNYFLNHQTQGISLRFCTEFHGFDETAVESRVKEYPRQPVILLNDQILCDFELNQMVKAHFNHDAAITCAVMNQDTGMGRIRLDSNKEVDSDGKMNTDYWNTGIYILSPHAADIILQEKKTACKCIFDEILHSGMQISCWNGKGYWRRIHNLQSYQQAQRDLLDGRVRCKLRGIRDEHGNLIAGRIPAGNFRLTAPVFIGEGVQFGNGVVIKAGNVLDDGCTLSSGAIAEGATLLPYSFVGERSCIKSSVVCSGAAVNAGTVLLDTVAAKNTTVRSTPLFEQPAVTGEVGIELTPELAVRIGCAVGTAVRGQTIGITADEFSCSRVLSSALIAGIRSAGTSVLDFGCAFKALFRFAMFYNALNVGISFRTGNVGSIQLMEKMNETDGQTFAQKIQTIFAENRFSRAPWDHFGGCVDMSGIRTIYRTELLRLAQNGLADMKVNVASPNRSVQNILTDALQKLGCEQSEGIGVDLSQDGMQLCLNDAYTHLSSERTKVLGNHIDREMVYERRDTLYRNRRLSTAEQNDWSRSQQSPVDDGLMLAVKLLNYMREHQLTLSQLDQLVPDMRLENVCERADKTASEQQLEKNGVLLLHPKKQNKSKRILKEVSGWETAQELCPKMHLEPNSLLDNERRNG